MEIIIGLIMGAMITQSSHQMFDKKCPSPQPTTAKVQPKK